MWSEIAKFWMASELFFQRYVAPVFQAMRGGHALLLAYGFPTGRSSLVRLVANLANYKVFELREFELT